MKKFKKLLCVVLLIFTIIISCSSVYAHELGYDIYGHLIALKLNDLNSSGGPRMHVHYADLRRSTANEYYYEEALDAVQAWTAVEGVTNGGCNQTSTAYHNIKITYSQAIWDFYGFGNNTLGFASVVDTNGIAFHNIRAVWETSGKIAKTTIFLNPTGDIFSQGASSLSEIKGRIQKTIVHEIGHALGLGHSDRSYYNPIPSETYSVMRQGFPYINRTGITPRHHEVVDVETKYLN